MGLYDRDYMGGDYRGGGSLKRAFAGWSAVKFLIVLNVVSFVAGAFADKAFGFGAYYQLFELSWQNLAQGKIWTVLTYSILQPIAHSSEYDRALFYRDSLGTHYRGEKVFCSLFVWGIFWRICVACDFGRRYRRPSWRVGFGYGCFCRILLLLSAGAYYVSYFLCASGLDAPYDDA